MKEIVKNTVANFLCFILDNYEGVPLYEEELQGIGLKFLNSKRYNKPVEPTADAEPVCNHYYNFESGECVHCGEKR